LEGGLFTGLQNSEVNGGHHMTDYRIPDWLFSQLMNDWELAEPHVTYGDDEFDGEDVEFDIG
jgi:hypothetical protein